MDCKHTLKTSSLEASNGFKFPSGIFSLNFWGKDQYSFFDVWHVRCGLDAFPRVVKGQP